jgi:metallo-beta-lactamase family protein
VLESMEAVPFGETVTREGVSFTFRRAEHLLGAAFIEACISGYGREITVVFSGDLGAGNSVLLRPPETCAGADYVVMESTYGGVVRAAAGEEGNEAAVQRHRRFAEMIGGALRAGGDVLIPSFTLGRTQEVCAVIDFFRREGVIPEETDVYVDSPTARKVTVVYRRSAAELSRWAREFYADGILRSAHLHEVKSRVSLAVHDRKHDPAVFVSSSGDLDHANAPRHLMKMHGDPANLLCIVGWQPPGSLGARLAAGDSVVLVRYREGRGLVREWISPVLAVERVTSFSGHADQRGLIDWLGSVHGAKKVFLVHGEADQAAALAEAIAAALGLDVEVPRRGERFTL